MKVRVLKQFLYAHDGNSVHALHAGEDHEVRDEFIAGLTAAGLVAPAGVPADGGQKRSRKPRSVQTDQPAAEAPASVAPGDEPKLPIE